MPCHTTADASKSTCERTLRGRCRTAGCWVAEGTGCSDDDEELDDEESVSPESDASLDSKRSVVPTCTSGIK